jgi:hypothetical protein
MKMLTNEEVTLVSGGGAGDADGDGGIMVYGEPMSHGAAFALGVGMYNVGNAFGGNALAIGVAAGARSRANGASKSVSGARGTTVTAGLQVIGTVLVNEGCDVMARSGLIDSHPYYANQCGFGQQGAR